MTLIKTQCNKTVVWVIIVFFVLEMQFTANTFVTTVQFVDDNEQTPIVAGIGGLDWLPTQTEIDVPGPGAYSYHFNQNITLIINTTSAIKVRVKFSSETMDTVIGVSVSAPFGGVLFISTFSEDEFTHQGPKRKSVEQGLGGRWKKAFDSYVGIKFQGPVKSVTVAMPLSVIEYEEDSGNLKWALQEFEETEEWKSLDATIENETAFLSLSGSDVQAGVYLVPVMESRVEEISNWWLVIVGVAVAILIGAAVMTKTEFLQHLKRSFDGKTRGAHRLSYYDIIENENRSKIIDLVLEEPGIHFSEIQRRLGISAGNLAWHLDVLETYHVIKKERVGHFLVYYPVFVKNPITEEELKLSKSKQKLQILSYIEEHPNTYATKIAKELGMNRKTVSYHLKQLEEGGFLESKKAGRKLLYRVTGN